MRPCRFRRGVRNRRRSARLARERRAAGGRDRYRGLSCATLRGMQGFFAICSEREARNVHCLADFAGSRVFRAVLHVSFEFAALLRCVAASCDVA